jgi:hypothetical protein
MQSLFWAAALLMFHRFTSLFLTQKQHDEKAIDSRIGKQKLSQTKLEFAVPPRPSSFSNIVVVIVLDSINDDIICMVCLYTFLVDHEVALVSKKQ